MTTMNDNFDKSARMVPWFIRPSHNILPCISEYELVNRLKKLFDESGIKYTYSNYMFQFYNDSAILTIYRNEGPYTRKRDKYADNSIELPDDTLNFVIELDDRTRKYVSIFVHILENYEAETAAPFILEESFSYQACNDGCTKEDTL
jgi:hypothetical protein